MKREQKHDKTVLPKGVLKSDLTYPKDYKDYAFESFELWYTERFGWAIPTLTISNASSRQRERGVSGRRSYAIAVNDSQLVTLGLGPHLLATHTVYVKKSRLAALQPYLDLRVEGQRKAGEYRDRLSTRRVQGAMRRRERGDFPGIFGW